MLGEVLREPQLTAFTYISFAPIRLGFLSCVFGKSLSLSVVCSEVGAEE